MINVYHWNPKKNTSNNWLLSRKMNKKTINNFGDLIGPMIISRLVPENSFKIVTRNSICSKTLFSVGSVLHFAKNKDIVWGSGRNGKISENNHKFKTLDVRAVRGPLTQSFLNSKNIHCPDIYGDPALLLPKLYPEYTQLSKVKRYDYTIIPNLNDELIFKQDENLISPLADIELILKRIVQSRFVAGSSLHAIIVAEAFGVPARLMESKSENHFKYNDYYLGTGRLGFHSAKTVNSALDLGGEPAIKWNYEKLLKAFPFDLFGYSISNDIDSNI